MTVAGIKMPKKTMKRTSLLLLACTLIFGNSAHLKAQVLYDNGAAAIGSAGYGFDADTNAFDQTEIGDTFTATTSGTAGVISFGGLYYGGDGVFNGVDHGTYGDDPEMLPSSESFVISLYATTSGGAPDTSVAHLTSTLSNVTLTPLGLGASRSIYEFSGILDTPFTLTLGQSYFLSINATTNPDDDFAVDVTSNPVSTKGYGKSQGSSTFDLSGSTPLSFSLAVPEPKEWAFALTGVAVLWIRLAARWTVQGESRN
jgi:hypothetical protein